MLYYFKDKHRLSEVKLEFKGQNYMFNSYEMEWHVILRLDPEILKNQANTWDRSRSQLVRSARIDLRLFIINECMPPGKFMEVSAFKTRSIANQYQMDPED